MSQSVGAGWIAAGALLALLAAPGCAAPGPPPTARIQAQLRAAGFSVERAQTPLQREHLAGLAKRQMLRVQVDETTRYVYADAAACGCIYVGTPQAYERYLSARGEALLGRERDLETTEILAPAGASLQRWRSWQAW